MARVSEAPRRSFRYQPRSKENVRERANMRGGNFDSIIKPQYKIYKIREGKNLVRFLPPTWEGAKHYGFDLHINYNIGADNQSYLSLGMMKGEKDPLAEAKREAERDGDKKLAKDLQPRQRIACWVIDRQAEDEGPLLMLCPFTLDKAIANLSFDEDTKEVMFLDDPENGCDVRFFKEGSGLNTDYPGEKIKLLKPSPLNEDEGIQEEWLTYVAENPIPDCLQYYSYEHIAMTFNGNAGRDEAEEEEVQPRRKPIAKPADDNDDEDEPPFEPVHVRNNGMKTYKVGPDNKAVDEEEEGETPPPRQSIRERLARRRPQADEED